MKTIYKYKFQIADEIVLWFPQGATILHVECQDGKPCLWALVDPANEPQRRRFRIYGTGHEVDDPTAIKHVATFQSPPYAWHLFAEPTVDDVVRALMG